MLTFVSPGQNIEGDYTIYTQVDSRSVMYKIKIHSVGKNRESWLINALSEYEKRLKNLFTIEWLLAKDTPSLTDSLAKEKSFIALDPLGTLYSSPEFSQFLFQTLQNEGCRLNIVIGGDEGLSPEVKARARSLVSFSKMTFTHQMTRLILLEQIYRSSEIQRGSPYHK